MTSTCKGNAGFSLLEAVLAIGILAVVTIQIINVQTASMEISGTSRQNQQATWALRSATAQLQYVLDAYGVEGLRPKAEFSFGAEKQYSVLVESKETTIEASRLFSTAVKMAQALGGDAGASEDEDDKMSQQYKEIGQTLDSQIPKDIYRTIKVTVSWKQGEASREIEGGFLVVDEKGLTVGSDLQSLMGAAGGAAGGGGAAAGETGGGTGGGGTGGGTGGGAGGGKGGAGGGNEF
jgi:uncharacterized membrane protein YgcG